MQESIEVHTRDTVSTFTLDARHVPAGDLTVRITPIRVTVTITRGAATERLEARPRDGVTLAPERAHHTFQNGVLDITVPHASRSVA
jgi:HSP20 family molecular chaperone IbpA